MAEFRKEWKYVISVAEYLRLKPWLEQLMKPDPNGVDGSYTLRSLYFDSLYDRDLYDNLEGVREKQKIRLRAYLPNLDRAKLECKAKDGSDGIKYAIWLSLPEIKELLLGNYLFLSEKGDKVSGYLYRRMSQGIYRPKTIVEYSRTAYLYPVGDTRVTFDRSLRASAAGLGFLNEHIPLLPLMPENMGVLEIKYSDFLPYPIEQLMEKLDSSYQANSKYTEARNLI